MHVTSDTCCDGSCRGAILIEPISVHWPYLITILSSAATLGVSKHSLDLLCNVIFIEETVYQGIIHIKGHAQLHQ